MWNNGRWLGGRSGALPLANVYLWAYCIPTGADRLGQLFSGPANWHASSSSSSSLPATASVACQSRNLCAQIGSYCGWAVEELTYLGASAPSGLNPKTVNALRCSLFAHSYIYFVSGRYFFCCVSADGSLTNYHTQHFLSFYTRSLALSLSLAGPLSFSLKP